MKIVKRLGIVLGVLAAVYLAASAALFLAMRQPPEQFGAIMAKVPRAAMFLLPFPPLWKIARGGTLAAGDPAPDFLLPLTDRSRMVQLSSEWRERPVVLIFGSYT